MSIETKTRPAALEGFPCLGKHYYDSSLFTISHRFHKKSPIYQADLMD